MGEKRCCSSWTNGGSFHEAEPSDELVSPFQHGGSSSSGLPRDEHGMELVEKYLFCSLLTSLHRPSNFMQVMFEIRVKRKKIIPGPDMDKSPE